MAKTIWNAEGLGGSPSKSNPKKNNSTNKNLYNPTQNSLAAQRDYVSKPVKEYLDKNKNTGSGGSGGGGSSYVPPVQQPQQDNRLQDLINYAKQQNQNSRNQALQAIESALSNQINLYNDRLSQLEKEYSASRDSALNALESNYQASKNNYDLQIEDLTDEYYGLRNQSEVERYKAKSAMREALANRGQLDSGYGRQETLEMQTNYGNAINNLNKQEQAQKQVIANLITQLQNDTNSKKTDINNQYNNQLTNAQTSVKNAIAQLQSDAESRKASINQQYDNVLNQLIAQMRF